MQACRPDIKVPGDNGDNIMARSGDCVGMSSTFAVWRFGFLPESEAAVAYKTHITGGNGFLWVFATRKTGKIKEQRRGYALELPLQYKSVIDWEPGQ